MIDAEFESESESNIYGDLSISPNPDLVANDSNSVAEIWIACLKLVLVISNNESVLRISIIMQRPQRSCHES